jgi:hypothetical protein
MEHGRSRIAWADMWKVFEDIQPYLTGLTLTLEQRSTFKEKVEAFWRGICNPLHGQLLHPLLHTSHLHFIQIRKFMYHCLPHVLLHASSTLPLIYFNGCSTIL